MSKREQGRTEKVYHMQTSKHTEEEKEKKSKMKYLGKRERKKRGIAKRKGEKRGIASNVQFSGEREKKVY